MNKIDIINNLINTLVSEPLGLKIDLKPSSKNLRGDDQYLIIDAVVFFDPIKTNSESNQYSENYVNVLWDIDSVIKDNLKYFGDKIILDNVRYIAISTKIYDDIIKKLKRNQSEIQNKIKNEGLYDIQIKDFEIKINDLSFDAALEVTLKSESDMKNKLSYQIGSINNTIWNILDEYVNTDTFIVKFKYEDD